MRHEGTKAQVLSGLNLQRQQLGSIELLMILNHSLANQVHIFLTTSMSLMMSLVMKMVKKGYSAITALESFHFPAARSQKTHPVALYSDGTLKVAAKRYMLGDLGLYCDIFIILNS